MRVGSIFNSCRTTELKGFCSDVDCPNTNTRCRMYHIPPSNRNQVRNTSAPEVNFRNLISIRKQGVTTERVWQLYLQWVLVLMAYNHFWTIKAVSQIYRDDSLIIVTPKHLSPKNLKALYKVWQDPILHMEKLGHRELISKSQGMSTQPCSSHYWGVNSTAHQSAAL